MRKNEIHRVTITDASAEGFGVGRVAGMAVFVPLTAVGDTADIRIVKVKSNYAFGRLVSLETPSPDRVEPDCPCFAQCGGCAWRHISYAAECAGKERRVADALTRIGGLSVRPAPLLAAASPDRYRNKAQYPVDAQGAFGFYARHSHRVVPCADCRLQPALFAPVAAAVSDWVRRFDVPVYDAATHRGLLRHLYLREAGATGELMVTLVVNGDRLPAVEALLSSLQSAAGERLASVVLNRNTSRTNVILGDACRTLYGKDFITDVLCGVRVRLSPLSFYQVNRPMAEVLYRKAAEYAEPAGKRLLDLYCGTGTVGLSMAHDAAGLTGVEIVPVAVADAVRNAADNGIANARFLCADAAEAAARLARAGQKPDVVLLDPPRKGCDEALLETVAHDFAPERIVYISCDPATLARDAARLQALGYPLREVTPVDLFPRTAHVECVALFTREIS